ncbi:response regulator [Parvularcula maris]|uniref:Response regulator n=1 Tax=Parvularcula maris TaxID=2965077 RepID=A0A9X2L9E7_9PROT|nr:response regulator [Parvularcula maris]MCQ8185494.1 response regulator [Parvularcula maris]
MSLVLLVEDNIMVAMMMQLDLEQAGHQVLGPFARNAEALEAAHAAVDLALVDIDLAGGDRGTDLARMLRETHGICCLFVTGQAAEAENHHAYAIGVLTKPFASDRFVSVVNAALAKSKGVEHDPLPKVEAVSWF